MKAPNFTLQSLFSNEVVNLSDYMGKPIILTFWVSWCPDCIRDLKHKNELYESIDKDKLVFLTINVTGREGNESDGIKFMKDNNYHFPVFKDEGTKYYDMYKCSGVPSTFLIDRNYNIIASYGDKAVFTDIMEGVTKII